MRKVFDYGTALLVGCVVGLLAAELTNTAWVGLMVTFAVTGLLMWEYRP